MPPPGLVYRSKTDADRPFLALVYASTRTEELAMVPWTPAQRADFLAMQFNAQWQHYERFYPEAEFLVIEQDGQPIGRLYIDRGPDEICLVDIALVPAARGAGLGTLILREILDEARATHKAVAIHVERFNPALRLYQRLGFQPAGENGVYYLMRWSPAAAAVS
ncbi:MAG: GNAT family N-acetyltransferase [Betaproteobacteria bacterium]|nr:GNAT family N-acetyltransferase [Betaproteobacteria bacterium]